MFAENKGYRLNWFQCFGFGTYRIYACRAVREYLQYYDNDYVVMIVKGSYVEDGHDEEPVVDISEIVEIWDYDEFVEVYQDYVERK